MVRVIYHFDSETAARYGVDEAVFIAMLQYWIAKNEANDRHFYAGRYWTYNSIRALEKLYPFWSRRQLERIIRKLKSAGVLLTGAFARDGYDRTTFYALDETKLPAGSGGKDLSPNGDDPCHQTVTTCHQTVKSYNEQDKYQDKEEEADKLKPGDIADQYGRVCTSLPRVLRLTDKRRRAVRILLSRGYTAADFAAVFRKAQRSSFCTGKNDRGWKADFDWLMREANFVKVLEGKYDDAEEKPRGVKGQVFETWD